MLPDPVTALARKWCDYQPGEHDEGTCPAIVGAAREALEEAEQAILTGYLNQYPDQDSQDDAAMRRAAAVAIAALREGG